MQSHKLKFCHKNIITDYNLIQAKMTDPHIIKVMESMGWTDGSLLPIANDENRKIMTLITELGQSKISKTSEIEGEGIRLENVQEHIKSHEGEFDHNMVKNLLSSFDK